MKKSVRLIIVGVILGLLTYHLISSRIDKPEIEYITTIDTLEIELPGRIDSFTIDKPTVKYVVKDRVDTNLINKYTQLKSDKEKLDKYLEAIVNRVYENSYFSNDSLLTITVIDSVQGILLKQSLTHTLSKRKVRIITEVKIPILIPPKKTVLIVGGAIKVGGNASKTSLEVIGGLRNKKGRTTYLLGLSSNNEVRVSILKDINFKRPKIRLWGK